MRPVESIRNRVVDQVELLRPHRLFTERYNDK